ncbi:MAG TPA: Clp protease N-terminal domain-containing protein, partial [Nitrospiria bacterium]|nr:Clp protease N-terminal domain-containing protein [Nitrospiria bacterium]
MIQFDRLTIKAQEAVLDAQKAAEKHGHQQLEVDHLLLSLVAQKDGMTLPLLKQLGADPGVLQKELEKTLEDKPRVSGGGAGQLYLSPELNRVMDQAQDEADRLKDDFISVEHLLLGILA